MPERRLVPTMSEMSVQKANGLGPRSTIECNWRRTERREYIPRLGKGWRNDKQTTPQVLPFSRSIDIFQAYCESVVKMPISESGIRLWTGTDI
jgi:hypothetical protein